MTKRTAKQKAQLQALAKLPDDQIDTAGIPAVDFPDAVRGRSDRPIKQPVSLRIDADVLNFCKRTGAGNQNRMNQALREFMNVALCGQKPDSDTKTRG